IWGASDSGDLWRHDRGAAAALPAGALRAFIRGISGLGAAPVPGHSINRGVIDATGSMDRGAHDRARGNCRAEGRSQGLAAAGENPAGLGSGAAPGAPLGDLLQESDFSLSDRRAVSGFAPE